jgi:hypothetical protein
LVLSLFGLIALPVVVGGVVDEVDDEDDVLEADDDVDVEAEEEGGFPELSCLIKSAARSAYSSALWSRSRKKEKKKKKRDSPSRRGPTSNEMKPGKARYYHRRLSTH